jgi:hypothetical protein
MGKWLSIVTMACVALTLSARPARAANPAETVPFDTWLGDTIQGLVSEGIIVGQPDGTYHSDKP